MNESIWGMNLRFTIFSTVWFYLLILKFRDRVSDVIREEFADRIIAAEREAERSKNRVAELESRHKTALADLKRLVFNLFQKAVDIWLLNYAWNFSMNWFNTDMYNLNSKPLGNISMQFFTESAIDESQFSDPWFKSSWSINLKIHVSF